MLAPYCEAEATPPVVHELGLRSLALWRQTYPAVVEKGTLVVAAARDRAELVRFASMTTGHATLNAGEIDAIEPACGGRFAVRSALELLGSAYALHPALGEAEILEAGAGVRPAFPDNVPKIVVRGRTLYVNGLYRHGFLLAPVLAELLAAYVERGEKDERVFVIEGN